MLNITIKTLKSWIDNDPFTASAAIAYYAIFSIPGLLVITLGITSLFLEADIIETQIFTNINQMLGVEVAESLRKIVQETSFGNRNIWAIVIGVGTLFLGATGLFVQLQRSLNHIWRTIPLNRKTHTPKFLKQRLLSFGMIVVIGFLLLVSLSITAFINILSEWLQTQIPFIVVILMSIIDLILSLGIISVLFMMIFKILPDRKVHWRHALDGGILSAILFHVGEYALNFYFELAEPASTFGAAGSIILLMLWVYYSGMILLLGAEFTKKLNENKA